MLVCLDGLERKLKPSNLGSSKSLQLNIKYIRSMKLHRGTSFMCICIHYIMFMRKATDWITNRETKYLHVRNQFVILSILDKLN